MRSLSGHLAPAIARTGGATQLLVNQYCKGRGIEIGPGGAPYAPKALMVDRYRDHHGRAIPLDVNADATALPIRSTSTDYLLSAHCLEHIPDTLAALTEWMRVLRPGGHLVLILPHVDRTFDRGRPLATLDHHLTERGIHVDPEDPPHWAEYARWSAPRTSEREPDGREARRPDGSWNARYFVETGSIHYHAWTQHEMTEVVAGIGGQICAVVERLPDRSDSFAIVARVHSGPYAPTLV